MGRREDYTSQRFDTLQGVVKSINPLAIANIADAMAGHGGKLEEAFGDAVKACSAVDHNDFDGQFREMFLEALWKIAWCAYANADAMKNAGAKLRPFADQAASAVKATGELVNTSPPNPGAARLAARAIGEQLNALYDTDPTPFGELQQPQSPGDPNASSGVTREGASSPSGGAPSPEALQALADQAKRESQHAPSAGHEAAAPATGADPSQAAKGLTDALGQAGQAAGQAAQSAGQAGKGMDPSQLASGLADALKTKGDGLGAGAGEALDVSDAETGLPGSTAGFAAPVGGLGSGGGGVAESVRPLSAATGHGGPTQQSQPASQPSSPAQQVQRPAAGDGGGMGSMPMGGMPHGQQGAGGRERRVPDYLKDQALLSDNPADQAVDAVIGELSAQEVEQREQQSLELADSEQSGAARA
ncbi:hypothetical protein Srot_2395 [Segniliparus rotundus DSM 44985]|uniref:Uncharacterized protein n=1 Tax=Segniliparus rotundus (strain ATCC BAA-972 / CDC 1076 / CIP 108378 / DSM 44985 / JCM 13578) TaxID=640132 RepID=D6ZAV3_SEGRD|nr:hypothetical protein [Segniliparus rotundus]ADG98839.1 hypothetical protein Srot_2395 [Segniliparus rotundus DSM 44985]